MYPCQPLHSRPREALKNPEIYWRISKEYFSKGHMRTMGTLRVSKGDGAKGNFMSIYFETIILGHKD
jgi:hypothetical protein